MTRAPAYLAALASSAVPGLDPVAVRAARGVPGNRCDVAFVTDTQRRAWVVRVPTTPAVGAQLDDAVPLLGLIARRLPFQVPSPRGFVGVPAGRAVVYPFLHGRSVVLDEVPPGPGVAAELGRALAALHNVDRAVFEEAGVAVYDAETYRSRHLADLDRGAATGHVPTALLSRWERALEDVSMWRFAPTPVHGDVRGGRLLVSFAQEDDPGTATVRGITGWEHAMVADPADDLAAFADECPPETFESVVEAYAVARIERPDRHLRLRARLAAELRGLAGLLDAVTAGEPLLITRRAAELRTLDAHTADLPDLVPPPSITPEPARVVPAARAGVGAVAASGPLEDDDVEGDSDVDGERDSEGDAEVRADGGARGQSGQTSDETPEEPEEPEERDDSQDTQRLLVGEAAGATTVIPPEELARLRTVTETDETDETVVVVPVETQVAPDDSWYEVVEPIAPPERDDTTDTADTADDPDDSQEEASTPTEPAAESPTVVLVDRVDPAPVVPSEPTPSEPTPSEPTPSEPPPSEPPPSEPAAGPPARPGRRHRRATRPEAP